MRRLLPTVALLLGATGCQYAAYFVRDTHRPVQALEVRMDPHARRDCLVVFMPGMLDTPDSFVDSGFLRDAARASGRCDLVAVDAHFGYYRAGEVDERVTQDVLRVAEARGYRDIWIVGISMGGLGTLMVARDNPRLVRGVVLLAPFLGDEGLVRRVGDAGGLRAWDAPEGADPDDQDEFDEALWAWLQGYATDPEARPALYVGVGTEDSLRPGVQLLADVLPPGHHGTAPGGHGWTTWRVLWQRLLRNPPWDPAPAALARGEGPSF
ncbi:MAG TPA: alpha/beta fold hydrolase [Sandaracinaceae bacterium LLY-WYZ-13_1]|nr:alpha/beta fold hydrolase [Sandaracinaceae bacterium LLY-WYZ-13_1]